MKLAEKFPKIGIRVSIEGLSQRNDDLRYRQEEEIVFAEPGNSQSIADNFEWILTNKEASSKIALNGVNKAKELLDYTFKVPEMMDFVKMSH